MFECVDSCENISHLQLSVWNKSTKQQRICFDVFMFYNFFSALQYINRTLLMYKN